MEEWEQRWCGSWEGRPYYIGQNKEAYGAEVYAIYRALETIDQQGRAAGSIPSSRTLPRRLTALLDSLARDSDWRWRSTRSAGASPAAATYSPSGGRPPHQGVEGIEAADAWAKAAAEGRPPDDDPTYL